MLIDEQGLKQSFTDANNKVSSTRQSTLQDFNIDPNAITSNNPDKCQYKCIWRIKGMVLFLCAGDVFLL